MEIVLKEEQNKVFCSLFESLKNLNSVVPFSFEEDCLKIQVIDGSHVSLGILHLQKEFFKSYKIEKPVFISVSLPSFIKLLKILDPKKTWILSIHNEETLIVKTSDKKEFTLTLIDSETDMIEMENEDCDFFFNMDTSYLKNILKELKIHDAEEISLEYNINKMYFVSETDKGNCKIQIDIEKSVEKQLKDLTLENETSMYKVSYASSFIENFINPQICSNVSLYVSLQTPLKVLYKFDGGKLSFYVAPKFKEEDY